MFLHSLQVSFENIYYVSAKKPDKLFWAKLKEKTFALVGKRLKHLEYGDILFVLCPKTKNASGFQAHKNFREWI